MITGGHVSSGHLLLLLRGRPRARGGEELDQQLVDALGLVVVDPVRGVGQALDAVEVGHVIAVGLGQVRAEVAIPLPPNDERGRRDWVNLRFGALR